MTISDLRTHLLSVPFAEPPETGFLTLERMDLLVVEIEASDGTIGVGYIHPLAGGMRTLECCIHEMFQPLIVGASAEDPEALWDAMWRASFIQGRMGITVMAASAIDIALWDLLGKMRGQPLWQLWGGTGDAQPVYGSGCYRGLGGDGMIAKAERFVASGYTAIKMQVAHVFTHDEDVANVRNMRAALGPDIRIMVDVNQGWQPDEAIAVGRRLEPYDLAWLEEPVIADDIAGYRAVAAGIGIPLASGENHFLAYDMRDFLEGGHVPILQPDIMRGGYTGLRRLAASAQDRGLGIAPHLFPELSCHLTAAIPNALWLEEMGWHRDLWQVAPAISGGMLTPPDAPGHGLAFRPELFSEFPYRA